MKIAKIIPLYKSGDNQSYCNYRPISILPSLSKILEKTVYKRLTDYLNKYDILNTSQYGFRHGHSTSMALLDFVERIHEALDRKEYTIGVFLDLAKAFDTVNHNILLGKLEHYGIRGTPLLWFKDYLTNRKQYVHFQGTNSDMFDITCRVPQGSVLGPLLFLIYINDINTASCKLSFTLFADDTNIFNKNLQQLIRSTNEELSKLSLWFKANRLSLNITKTNYMLFSNRKKILNQNMNVIIDESIITRVKDCKFLGVIIDENLTWMKHINQVTSKISKNIGVMHKLSYYLYADAIKCLYYTLVYPYIHYGNIVWANNYPSKLTRIVLLQKRAVRIIAKVGYRESTAKIFKELRKLLRVDQINELEIGKCLSIILGKHLID